MQYCSDFLSLGRLTSCDFWAERRTLQPYILMSRAICICVVEVDNYWLNDDLLR